MLWCDWCIRCENEETRKEDGWFLDQWAIWLASTAPALARTTPKVPYLGTSR